MNRLPGYSGVAFTEAADGDQKASGPRGVVATTLGLTDAWATVNQVHGHSVTRALGPGQLGDADAIWTDVPGLPLAVFTADCLGVVAVAEGAIGVAHAGWRGAEQNVIGSLLSEMIAAGHDPERAVIGPGIGPCCFEVGPEVASRFPGHVVETSWGTASVDLRGVVTEQLPEIPVEIVDACTFHENGWFSHRRDGTRARLATIAWL